MMPVPEHAGHSVRCASAHSPTPGHPSSRYSLRDSPSAYCSGAYPSGGNGSRPANDSSAIHSARARSSAARSASSASAAPLMSVAQARTAARSATDRPVPANSSVPSDLRVINCSLSARGRVLSWSAARTSVHPNGVRHKGGAVSLYLTMWAELTIGQTRMTRGRVLNGILTAPHGIARVRTIRHVGMLWTYRTVTGWPTLKGG